jgi:D-alanyl-D-alanine carboxypeptidase/D-alanyl-D-alanine-endopeptidase (penicillin-binding protein 4)
MRFGVLTGTAIGAVALVGAGYALDGKRSSKNVSKPVVQLAQNSPSRPVAAQGSSPARPDFDRDRAQRLQEALTGLVNGPVLGRLRVGMRVMDVASGRVLFGQRDDALMDPASNQKVLATAAALLRLGGGWQFHTQLTGPAPDADGAIAGDLILRGNGDPSLKPAHLEDMAGQLAARGVTRINGAILADQRRIGADEMGVGERAPLRISRAGVEVRVRPGDHDGAPPIVSVRSVSDVFTVDNRARTLGRGRGRISVALSTGPGRVRISVVGKIALRHPGVVLRRVPPNPPLYAAVLLRQALQQAGIQVQGPAGLSVGRAREPRRTALAGRTTDTPLPLEPTAKQVVLAAHDSDPLPILMRRINKDSDNEWAERLLETVGAEIYGGPAIAPKGVRALREAIAELGLSPREYVSVNGSGLGHANRITPEAMADLLRRLFLDPRLGPDMLQSLSVGGVDGTTRNRFRGSPAAERVRAKTGTLNGKSCLAGYVGDGSDILAFSIMVQGMGARGLGPVRQAQVIAVNAMMRYARGAVGPAPLEEVAPAGVDFETGEEVADIEGESEEGESTTELAPPDLAVEPPAPPAPPAPPPRMPDRPPAPAQAQGVVHPEKPAPRTTMPAPPRPKDSFEEAVRKAFKAVPPEESFDQQVDKAFRELDKKGGKGKPPRK